MRPTPFGQNRIQPLVRTFDLTRFMRMLLMGAILTLSFSCGATTDGSLVSSEREATGETPAGGEGGNTPFDSGNMVQVNTPGHSFLIDPYEVSQLAPGDFFSVRNQIPHTGISKQQAREICAQSGKRLCTSFEWKNACLGIHRHRFSYGNSYKKGVCNVESSQTVHTATLDECRTDTGLYDMIGNGMEWVADEKGGRVMAMGGSFETGADTDCFTTFYFPSDFKSPQISFRCCH